MQAPICQPPQDLRNRVRPRKSKTEDFMHPDESGLQLISLRPKACRELNGQLVMLQIQKQPTPHAELVSADSQQSRLLQPEPCERFTCTTRHQGRLRCQAGEPQTCEKFLQQMYNRLI